MLKRDLQRERERPAELIDTGREEQNKIANSTVFIGYSGLRVNISRAEDWINFSGSPYSSNIF